MLDTVLNFFPSIHCRILSHLTQGVGKTLRQVLAMRSDGLREMISHKPLFHLFPRMRGSEKDLMIIFFHVLG